MVGCDSAGGLMGYPKQSPKTSDLGTFDTTGAHFIL